jgi:hypothetical protein
MYVPMRRYGAIILSVLVVLVSWNTPAHAQVGVPAIPPSNVAALGQAFALGHPFATAAFAHPLAATAGLGTGLNIGARFNALNNPLGFGSLAHSYANSPLGYASLMNGGGGLLGTALSGAALGAGYGFGMGMYGTQWMMNPYQGYLDGAANITNANAKYYQTIAQARMVREQAVQEHYRTRRAMMEQAEWEMAHRPDPEKIRQAALQRELDRARVSPPLTEIASGRSLNALLRNAIASQGQGLRSEVNPSLNEDTLKSINPTVGDTRGNGGLLKDNGSLQWPQPLQGEAFKEAREDLSRHLKQAVSTVRLSRNPNDSTLSDLQADLKKMHETLKDNASAMSEDQQVEATRYLGLLKNTIAALKDRNVVNLFNGTWTLRGKNVAELVKFMRDTGLWFAAATPGDEAAYTALYHALAAFDAGMPRPAHSSESGSGSGRGGNGHGDNNGAANP